MKRTQTIMGVRDVPNGVKWYQALFGQAHSSPVTFCPGSSSIVVA